MGGDSDCAPTTPRQSEHGDFEFEGPIFESDPDNIEDVDSPMALGATIATGRKISELSELIDRGAQALASIFFDAIEVGGKE